MHQHKTYSTDSPFHSNDHALSTNDRPPNRITGTALCMTSHRTPFINIDHQSASLTTLAGTIKSPNVYGTRARGINRLDSGWFFFVSKIVCGFRKVFLVNVCIARRARTIDEKPPAIAPAVLVRGRLRARCLPKRFCVIYLGNKTPPINSSRPLETLKTTDDSRGPLGNGELSLAHVRILNEYRIMHRA